MIAYFALLAFVPLTFLALSLLAFTGQPSESSFLVREIKQALPETPIEDIVRLVATVRDNAAALGLLGAAFLLWTALSLFSVLESAFNIVYGRPNRPFLHGKSLALALLVGSLVTLFVALLIGSFGVQVLEDWAPWFIDNSIVAYGLSVVVSTLGIFAFIVSVVLRAHERTPPHPRRAAGRDLRVRAAPDVVPDPAGVPALRGDQSGDEGVRLARRSCSSGST